MMDYAKQQATAIFDWIMGMPGHSFDNADAAIGQIESVLNSVPRPEPFGHIRRDKISGMELCLGDKEGAQPFWLQPVSAEPVNARLLDLVGNYIRLHDELADFDKHTHGGFATKETGLVLASQAYEKMKAAAEQAKPAPELTGSQIEEIALSLGPNFDDHDFARAVIKADRALRGEGK